MMWKDVIGSQKSARNAEIIKTMIVVIVFLHLAAAVFVSPPSPSSAHHRHHLQGFLDFLLLRKCESPKILVAELRLLHGLLEF